MLQAHSNPRQHSSAPETGPLQGLQGFVSVYKLYFILLWGKPLSNQNLSACLTCWLWEELECLLTRRALFIAGPCVHSQLSCNVARLYFFAFLLRVFNMLACFCFLPLLAVRMMGCNSYPHPDIQACLQSSSGGIPFSASSWFHFVLLFPKG